MKCSEAQFEKVLMLVGASTDEERMAGLLLATRVLDSPAREEDVQRFLGSVSLRFLLRLLRTEEDIQCPALALSVLSVLVGAPCVFDSAISRPFWISVIKSLFPVLNLLGNKPSAVSDSLRIVCAVASYLSEQRTDSAQADVSDVWQVLVEVDVLGNVIHLLEEAMKSNSENFDPFVSTLRCLIGIPNSALPVCASVRPIVSLLRKVCNKRGLCRLSLLESLIEIAMGDVKALRLAGDDRDTLSRTLVFVLACEADSFERIAVFRIVSAICAAERGFMWAFETKMGSGTLLPSSSFGVFILRSIIIEIQMCLAERSSGTPSAGTQREEARVLLPAFELLEGAFEELLSVSDVFEKGTSSITLSDAVILELRGVFLEAKDVLITFLWRVFPDDSSVAPFVTSPISCAVLRVLAALVSGGEPFDKRLVSLLPRLVRSALTSGASEEEFLFVCRILWSAGSDSVDSIGKLLPIRAFFLRLVSVARAVLSGSESPEGLAVACEILCSVVVDRLETDDIRMSVSDNENEPSLGDFQVLCVAVNRLGGDFPSLLIVRLFFLLVRVFPTVVRGIQVTFVDQLCESVVLGAIDEDAAAFQDWKLAIVAFAEAIGLVPEWNALAVHVVEAVKQKASARATKCFEFDLFSRIAGR